MAKWFVYNKAADFNKIGREHGIDAVLARILVNRGLTEKKEIDDFLHPSEKQLLDGSRMKDMEKAVSVIKAAILNEKRIRIIGDYDVDGIQATYILHQGLLRCGAKASYGIPHRMTDGYGLNTSLVEKCIKDNIEVILTCDNGIAARDAICMAKEAGLSVVVTDHHEVPYEQTGEEKNFLLPPADAIVNPKQPGCCYPFKNICGAVVAWKFVQALYGAMGVPTEEADVFLENAAFATIGDVMELVGENRTIVTLGLKSLRQTKNIGMQTLIKRCGLESAEISAYHIGFVLGPCFNASGRLDTATKAIELLEATDVWEAVALAEQLMTWNEERKRMTEQGVKEAIQYVETNINKNETVLVIYLKDVHESIAGIIAGRIREKYERPVFVLTDAGDGQALKGSGRSVEGFSMYEEMNRCGELFTKYGGHPMAAGLTLPKENLELFRQKINENTSVCPDDLATVIHIDVPMPFSYITTELVEQLALLEPFGNGNPKAVFAQKNVRIAEKKQIGKTGQFLKLTLIGEDGAEAEALYFGEREYFEAAAGEDNRIKVTYYPQINTYRGCRRIQVVITDVACCK